MPKDNIKQRRLDRESAAKQQANMDKKDAEKIRETLDALLNFDSIKAREIIKNPRDIASLMQLNRGLVCIYVMHAVAIALVSENCSEVLNEMSDDDIATLRKCISGAKQLKRPNAALTESAIQERQERRESGKIKLSKNGETRNMTPYEYWENEVMLKSMAIYQKVNAGTFWQDAIDQLQRWTDAIETFERADKMKMKIINTEPVKKVEKAKVKAKKMAKLMLLTIKQLSDKLNAAGLESTPKKIQHHVERCLAKGGDIANKIKTWFVFEETAKCAKGFIADENYFEQYKKEFASIRAYHRKPKAKQQEPVVAESPKPAEPDTPKTMLDVRAMDAFLTSLIELYEKANDDMEAAKQKRKSIATQINAETDEEKIEKMTNELADINAEVKQHKSVVDQLSRAKALADKKNQALDAKNAAERALRDAEVSFNSVVEEIAAFIESAKQNAQ